MKDEQEFSAIFSFFIHSKNAVIPTIHKVILVIHKLKYVYSTYLSTDTPVIHALLASYPLFVNNLCISTYVPY